MSTSPGIVEHGCGQVLAGLGQVGHGQAEGGQETTLRRTHMVKHSSQKVQQQEEADPPSVSPAVLLLPWDGWSETCWFCPVKWRHLPKHSQVFNIQSTLWLTEIDFSPWLSCDGSVTRTPLTEHWAPLKGASVTIPLLFSNMQCSLSRSRPCRTIESRGHRWGLQEQPLWSVQMSQFLEPSTCPAVLQDHTHQCPVPWMRPLCPHMSVLPESEGEN